MTVRNTYGGPAIGVGLGYQRRDFGKATITGGDVSVESSFQSIRTSDAIGSADSPVSRVNYTPGQNCFTCRINSIQMADEITASYHYMVTGEGEERTITRTYAAVDYFSDFDDMVQNGDITDQTTIDLVHALADYGHYVQKFLHSTKDWEFGVDYTEQLKHYTDKYEMDAVAEGVADQGVVFELDGSDVKEVSQALALDSETTISMYFKPVNRFSSFTASAYEDTDGHPAADCTVTKMSNGLYRVSIPYVSAHKLSRRYVVTANADNTTATVNISALSYVKAMLSYITDNETAPYAAAAIYYYAKAADDYMASHPQRIPGQG